MKDTSIKDKIAKTRHETRIATLQECREMLGKIALAAEEEKDLEKRGVIIFGTMLLSLKDLIRMETDKQN